MQFKLCAAALIISLTACGGGGGGDNAPAPSMPSSAIVITEANAKPVAASALEIAQSTSSTQGGANLVVGVELQSAAPQTPNTLLAMAQVARLAGNTARATALPVGVAISETQQCELGGTMTVTGNVAGDAGLFAGDNISIQANSCRIMVGGVPTTMNGMMSMRIVSGGIAGEAFQAVLAVTATDLSGTSGSTTMVASGTVQLDVTATSADAMSVTATGAEMSSRITMGATTRTTIIRNFAQAVVLNGSTVTSTFSASVETTSTALGANGGSYIISTPSPLVWDSVTLATSAGSIKVVGAAGSQLLVNLGAGNAVLIQVDANGDGTYEKNISSTRPELNILL